jgi:hypothetical protein
MSETTKYRGLCSTCQRVSSCTYPREADRPISYCCEYEGYEDCEGSVSLALLTRDHMLSRGTGSGARDTDSAVFKGLCGNCRNRDTCTFPKPEGGVWHCEEYE